MRLVIIGAGFAGMYAALSAARLRDIQGASPEELEIARAGIVEKSYRANEFIFMRGDRCGGPEPRGTVVPNPIDSGIRLPAIPCARPHCP